MATIVSLAAANSFTILSDNQPESIIPWATVSRIDPYIGPAFTTDRTAGTPTPAQVATGLPADIGGYQRRAEDEYKVIITAEDTKLVINLEDVVAPVGWDNELVGLNAAITALVAARNAATS